MQRKYLVFMSKAELWKKYLGDWRITVLFYKISNIRKQQCLENS